jgi:short-chain fatty acids transporter
MQSITRGAKGCGGIIIQFPLYAGIMAMMVASGLMGSLTELMVETGTQETIPIMTMLSAGVVNLFVPSGGGQWAIQAPIALESGLQTGVAPGTMVMAVAYGDQLTNMLQPFWALPLLAITGVRARDIVGYTAVVMIAAAIWIAFGLLLFG